MFISYSATVIWSVPGRLWQGILSKKDAEKRPGTMDAESDYQICRGKVKNPHDTA